MTDRLNKIFSVIEKCSVFADIGCDHGYMTKAMLDSGKCERALCSDVSAKCLEKAESLLSDYIAQGRVKSVVSDGFDNVGFCDLALIAGMGGEEICTIIERATTLPERLVLQPMKNADKVRLCAVKQGYRIEKDFIFKSAGKFYVLISLVKGKDSLTQDEVEFGRDNLKYPTAEFKEFIKLRKDMIEKLIKSDALSDQSRMKLLLERKKLEELC